ncbi:hypothetical protein FOMPIDRAFT_117943 [Fomitopsis schrenkii]|uniref:Uncharacterized protein n=1 Tax=Fomitopsis schrenkii TaxID=2126942 RepID=S8FYM1_FOMSC|nr:hypothetical protein FOMPIDRAFT_117943 [Fomitopsis schrenkii]
MRGRQQLLPVKAGLDVMGLRLVAMVGPGSRMVVETMATQVLLWDIQDGQRGRVLSTTGDSTASGQPCRAGPPPGILPPSSGGSKRTATNDPDGAPNAKRLRQATGLLSEFVNTNVITASDGSTTFVQEKPRKPRINKASSSTKQPKEKTTHKSSQEASAKKTRRRKTQGPATEAAAPAATATASLAATTRDAPSVVPPRGGVVIQF